MTTDGVTHPQAPSAPEFEYADLETPPRRARITETPVMRGIIDVTMVGLVGGGPRLAMRAARVMLEENYSSRASREHQGRRRRMTRRSG